MRTAAIDILLALAVLAAWLGTIGFLRLKAPLDRLHCVTFVNVAAGGAILVAVLLADGPSDRVLKVALLLAAILLTGGALAHATGRALFLRGRRK